jgi:hypothetical protein
MSALHLNQNFDLIIFTSIKQMKTLIMTHKFSQIQEREEGRGGGSRHKGESGEIKLFDFI